MSPDQRALLAVARKELRVLRRYPLTLLNTMLLMPLYQLVLPVLLLGTAFLVKGRSLGMDEFTGTSDFGGWLSAGLVGATVTGTVLSGPAQAMASERGLGTLEQTWAMPVSRRALVLGLMTCMTGLSLIAGVAMAVLVSLIAGARYGPGTLLALPVFAALLPGLAGMGLVSASLSLLWRQAVGLTDNLGYVVTVLAGVTFPVAVLWDALRPVSYLIPTTWAIDLSRRAALGADSLYPPAVEVCALVATSGLCLAGGSALFGRVERRMRAEGALGQH
ncbi:ABC-type multidrug transport system, permease component [Actinomadura meyerae]|uniref:Transport permease protein n=1 Tax=Actinomadura meyerae TaxID=240840 RepID=A0A239NV10_9ACTN|nr:ABC transporter permease [Actinomadura meyerae]SNT58707.1 ABC-type multidrug transport system, permease component [Actinomadura meyerae]